MQYQWFSPLCTRVLFALNISTVFLSFYCIGCESFAVFIKFLFDHLRRYLLPSLSYSCACETSDIFCANTVRRSRAEFQDSRIWSPKMGHLNGFWPGEIGNLNNSFQKSQMLALIGGGGGGGVWSFDLTDTLGDAYSDVSGNSKAKQLTGSRWRAALPCKEKRRHCHGLRHVRTWVLLLFWELFWRQLRNA